MHSAYTPFGLYNLMPQFAFFVIMLLPFTILEREKEENNNLKEVSSWNQNIGTPGNTMNNKVSAHYIEIENLYMSEMLPKYENKYQEIVQERSQLSIKEKKEKYANKNSSYELMKHQA